MPAYLTASETFFLHLIWRTSLLLAAVSLVILIGLIFRRAAGARRSERRMRRGEFISEVLLAAVNAPVVPTSASLPKLQKDDPVIIMRSALDLVRALEGKDVARIVQALAAWDMLPHIRTRLISGNRGKQVQALTLLSHFNDEESLGLLYRYAEHADAYVQLAALRGLAARGAQEHLPHILAQLAYTDQHNTMMLADVLQRFGEPAVPMLTALAGGTAPMEVRLAAILSLGNIGSLASVEPLIMLAGDPLADIRAQSLASLARIGDPRAVPAVLYGLDEEQEGVRVQAVQAAGMLKLQEALPRLAELLSDASWWIRYRAAEALLQLDAASFLKTKAAQDDKAGRMAQMVLAEKGVA